MKRALFGAAAVLLFVPCARADEPQYTHEIKLALLNARDAGRRTAATRFDFAIDGSANTPGFSGAYTAEAKGTVALKPSANNENLTAWIGGGVQYLIGGDVPIQLGPPPDPNAPAPPPPPAPRQDFVTARLKIASESDQTFENAQLTVGPELGYAQLAKRGLWVVVPDVHVSYDRVHVYRSTYLSDRGIRNRDFWRLEADAAWDWRPFATATTSAALSALGLQGDLRFFRSYDIPSETRALGLEESVYQALTISYEVSNFGWRYIDQLYVTVAHGRLPPSTRKDTTVWLGVVFGRKNR